MKAFLSHSSKDKAGYVRIVANKLIPNIIYDEMTFEEGMDTLSEILEGIQQSEIFVLFLSNNSLDSSWVKKEILEAKNELEDGLLNKFFPIIIDKSISYNDHRIPNWIRDKYNLKPITKPTLAAKRIKGKLIEISWDKHPKIKERRNVFVGRNNLLGEIEERLDDVMKDNPIVIFASGLREIGRKTILLKSLKKASIFRDSYEPIKIVLEPEDGIESLILKLADIGYSDRNSFPDLLDISVNEKEKICRKLLEDISGTKEVIFIDDNNCLIKNGNEIVSWFTGVINLLDCKETLLCVASTTRASLKGLWKDNKYYSVQIPELDNSERNGLFGRYLKILEISVSKDRMTDFCSLLTGYPEQVIFTADSIKNYGVEETWKDSDRITKFSSERASSYIQKYESNLELLSFLRFISSFEFVSLDFLETISKSIKVNFSDMSTYLQIFINDSICERIGVSGEYFRVNNVIRDYIIRNELLLENKYKIALSEFADEFIKSYESEDYDMSEYQIAIKEALSSKKSIPDSLLTPAFFLKSMKDLYRGRKNEDVVLLADRVLQKVNNYDAFTEQDVRYYLCLSLARLHSNRFLKEVNKIKGTEHYFLMGFFYRLKGDYKQALEFFKKVDNKGKTIQRAKQEIVLILIKLEDYEEALSLAKDNYNRYSSNYLMIQSYFRCLISQDKSNDNEIILSSLLKSLENISGEKSEEIFMTNNAIFKSKYDDDFDKSFDILNEAEMKFPNVIYPVLARLDMSIYHRNNKELIKSLKRLKDDFSNIASSKIQISKGEYILSIMNNDRAKADTIFENDLSDFSETAKRKLKQNGDTIIKEYKTTKRFSAASHH